ncbi:MAG: carboxypeptidase-like regulatory domain-containing protein, partial [Terriglobia bacterium]
MQKIARMISVGVICGTLAFATAAIAQNTNSGDIRGTVTDPSGAIVPGVTVKVTNVNTGVTKTFITNDAGLYDTVSTPPGDYKITFTKPGFKQLTLGPVVLRVAIITENAALQVGAVTQNVTVTTGGAPLLQTETGQQGTVMVASDIEKLPQL